MGSEKFCLRWNDFESNISCAFRELRDDKDFFDVTLACDDDQIQAHKVIISACSPFFRNILRRNPHQHPLLYLKGVKYTDLQSVLNFMYHGEVNVAQEELNSFLAVAEDLKVKGLTQNQSAATQKSRSENNSIPKPHAASKLNPKASEWEAPLQKRTRPSTPSIPASYNQTADYDDIQEIIPVKPEPIDPLPPIPQPAPIISTENQHYTPESQAQALAPSDDQSLAYQENYEDYGQYEVEQEFEGTMEANKGDLLVQVTSEGYQCMLCGVIMKHMKNFKRHKMDKHSEQQSHVCRFCNKSYRSKNSMESHQYQYHKEEISKMKAEHLN